MRLTTIAIATLLLLPACGQAGGDAERQTFIAGAVDGCVEAAQRGKPPPGVDVRSFCTCSVNKIAEGKSNEELLALTRQNVRTPAEEENMRQCITEAMGPGGK